MKKAILVIIVFVGMWGLTMAQPGDPNDGAAPGQEAPISGIEWLLLSGGLLGARKVFQRFRKQ